MAVLIAVAALPSRPLRWQRGVLFYPITRSMADRRLSSRLMTAEDRAFGRKQRRAAGFPFCGSVTLVDIGALGCAAGELLGARDTSGIPSHVFGTAHSERPWLGNEKPLGSRASPEQHSQDDRNFRILKVHFNNTSNSAAVNACTSVVC